MHYRKASQLTSSTRPSNYTLTVIITQSGNIQISGFLSPQPKMLSFLVVWSCFFYERIMVLPTAFCVSVSQSTRLVPFSASIVLSALIRPPCTHSKRQKRTKSSSIFCSAPHIACWFSSLKLLQLYLSLNPKAPHALPFAYIRRTEWSDLHSPGTPLRQHCPSVLYLASLSPP